MGACDFGNTIVIKGNANDAYREACAEMRDYNGHQDGYSGDIQTTSGFSMYKGEHPPYGTKEYYDWEDERVEEVGKRECECIEIKGAALDKIRERRGNDVRGFRFYGLGAC